MSLKKQKILSMIVVAATFCLSATSEEATDLCEQANCLAHEGDVTGAEALLNEKSELVQSSARLERLAAHLSYAKQDYAEALIHIDRALTMSDAAVLHIDRAVILAELGDYDAAVASADTALEMSPESAYCKKVAAHLNAMKSGQSMRSIRVCPKNGNQGYVRTKKGVYVGNPAPLAHH